MPIEAAEMQEAFPINPTAAESNHTLRSALLVSTGTVLTYAGLALPPTSVSAEETQGIATSGHEVVYDVSPISPDAPVTVHIGETQSKQTLADGIPYDTCAITSQQNEMVEPRDPLQGMDPETAFQIMGPAFSHYFNFLHRTPDIDGLLSWLSSGLSNREVGIAFMGTPEWQAISEQMGDPNFVNTNAIISFYNYSLRRPADIGGLNYWQAQLSRGAQLSDISLWVFDAPEGQSTIRQLFNEWATNYRLGSHVTSFTVSCNPGPVQNHQ